MTNITKEDLFRNENYFKFKVPVDPDYVYTAWLGADREYGGKGPDTIIVCWVEDGLNHGIDYKIDEVVKYINKGSWVIVE